MTVSEPDGPFRWIQTSWGRALVCLPLEAATPRHFFTTRDLDLPAAHERRQEVFDRIASAIGVSPRRLVRLRQVHRATVYQAIEGNLPESGELPEADAATTGDPTIGIAVQVADCVPILLADCEGHLVAAVHAGWRGTAAGVAVAAVGALRDAGAAPDRLIAAMGPSIGPCCYEVGGELITAFEQAGHSRSDTTRWFTRQSDGSLRLDVPGANRDQLVAAGLPSNQVFASDLCTACRLDLFHSFRKEGTSAGRMVAAISPSTA